MRYWERQPDETAKAYRAFQCYRDMGAERSVRKVAKQLGYKDHTALTRWMSKHGWVDRAEAYDGFLEMERRVAVEEYERGRAVEQARRAEALQRELLEVKERLVERLKVMVAWPLERREVVEEYEDGREKVVVIEPARWDFNTLARALATLEEKGAQKVDLRRVDLDRLTDRQLERLSQGEDLLSVLTNPDKEA